MNIEKIKSLIVKKDIKDKKKIENLIFFLVILIITLIAINYIFKDSKKNKTNNTNSTNKELVIEDTIQNDNMTIQTNLEESLENILSKIKGVGNVKVLITYNQSSKITPIYNESSSQSITEENDSDGGTRKIENFDSDKQVVSDSNSQPVTEKISMPTIEGAVVIAKGANNTTVKNNIINAVEAATGLSSHKIQVFEMND